MVMDSTTFCREKILYQVLVKIFPFCSSSRYSEKMFVSFSAEFMEIMSSSEIKGIPSISGLKSPMMHFTWYCWKISSCCRFSISGNNHKPQILQEWKWRKFLRSALLAFRCVNAVFSAEDHGVFLLYIVDDTVGADIAFAGPFQDGCFPFWRSR